MISNNSQLRRVLFFFFLFFAFVGNTTNYYVNYTYDATKDIFCTASGVDAVGKGKSPSSPAKTLSWLIKNSGYIFASGDVIYVDADNYLKTDEAIPLSINGIKIQGAGTSKTVFSYLGFGNASDKRLFNLNADNIVLSDFYITGYGYCNSDFAKAIDIKAGLKGIKINNIKTSINSCNFGLYPIEVHANAEVEFNGGGGACNHQSAASGGGVRIESGTTKVVFNNYLFAGNYHDGDGTALRIEGGNVNLNNCLIEDNEIGSNGKGAVYVNGGVVSIKDSKFYRNYGYTQINSYIGSNLYIEGGTVNMTRSIVSGYEKNPTSSGAAYGGGVTVNGASAIFNVDSTLFELNKASRGNDIYLRSGTVNAFNCTFKSTYIFSTASYANRQLAFKSGAFNVSNCGNPSKTVSAPTASAACIDFPLLNTIDPSYTPNPILPPSKGDCSTSILMCTPATFTTNLDCNTSRATVTANGLGNFKWYNKQTGGTVFHTGNTYITSILTADTTFYLQSSLDACDSLVEVKIVFDCPKCPTISYPSASYCQVGNAIPSINPSTTGTFSCSSTDLVINPTTGEIDLVNSKPGTYTVKCDITAGVCEPTTDIIINPKPATPTFGTLTNPTCNTPGSVIISGLPLVTLPKQWSLKSTAKYNFSTTGNTTTYNYTALKPNSKIKFIVELDGCLSDSTAELTVANAPEKPIIEGPSQVCIGSIITLKAWKDNSKIVNATPNASNPWVSENGNVTLTSGSDINIKGITAGISKITFTDVNNCIAEQTITVNSLPLTPSLSHIAANPLIFSGNLSDTVCKGNNVDFNLSGTAGNTVYFKGKSTPHSVVIDPSGLNELTISQLLKDTVVVLDSISNGSCSMSLSSQLKFVVSDTALTVKANNTTSCLSSTGTIDVTTSSKGRISWSNVDLSVTGTHTVSTATTYQIPNLKADTYTITFFNGGCELTRTVTISDPDKPKTPSKIESSGPTTFCEGGSITLTASTIPGSATINWTKDGAAFGNPNDNTITVTASGTYAVTVTISGCTSDANDTIITVNPLPEFPVIDNVDLNQKFCKSENAKVSNLKPTSGIVWFDVNGVKLSSTDNLVTTDYYAALESDKGCFTENSKRIKVSVEIKNNPSDPVATTPQTFCKVDNKTVADLVPKSSGTIEIVWYLGSTVQLTTDKLQKGTYTVESVESGCTSLNKKTVVVDVIDVPIPNLSTDKLCANNQASLTLADVYKGVSNYYFYDILTSNILSGTKTIANGEQYVVKQSLNGCLSDGLTITIAISNGPSLSSNPYILTPSLCEVDKPTFDDVEAKYSTLPTSSGTLFWYVSATSTLSNSIDKNIQVATGSYWLAVKDASGCYSKKQEVKLTVDPGIKPTLKPIELCSTSEYKVVDLNVANISNPAGIITWYYANGGTNVADNSISVSKDPSVQYWASYKKSVGECEGEMVKLDLTWIKFNQNLILDETNQKFCKTVSKTISDLNLSPYSSAQVAWFDDETSIDVLPNTTPVYDKVYYAAEYKITSDSKYCINSNRAPIDVNFYSTKLYPTVKEGVCTKQNGSIEFINPPADYTFNWYELSDETKLDFTGAKYTKPLEKQSFKIVMNDAVGCKDSVTVSMPQCTDSPIPQIITPGDEKYNNKWVINYASKYKDVQVRIFNRWGNEVYSSPIPYSDDWEGKYNNEYLPTGTYYYVIDKGNGEPIETGFIELVK